MSKIQGEEHAQYLELIVTKHGGSPEEHENPVEPGKTAANPEESPHDHEPIVEEQEEITKEHKETNRKDVTRVTFQINYHLSDKLSFVR